MRDPALKTGLIVVFASIVAFASSSHAEDTSQPVAKALADYRAAAKQAVEVDRKIQAEKEALSAEVDSLEKERRDLESGIIDLEKRLAMGEAKQGELTEASAEKSKGIQGITSHVVSAAHDLEALMRQSPLTAFDPNRLERLQPFLEPDRLLGPSDVAALSELYLDEISFSGRVGEHQASYLDHSGGECTGKIVTFGKLTAIYEDGDETGFLLYSPTTQKLSVCSKRPSRAARKGIRSYLSGQDDAAPLDLSFGQSLVRAAQKERLTVRTRKGGAVLLALVIAALMGLAFRYFDRRLPRLFRWVRAGESGIVGAISDRWLWGVWAIKPQASAHRTAIATMFLCALIVYVRGATVVGHDDSQPVQVNLVNLVSISPPPIAGQRMPRSVAPVSRLAEYVPSTKVTRGSAQDTDFQPELVSPTVTSPFAEGEAQIDVAVDLKNLMSENAGSGTDVVFESYQLDQPPQAVVKIPPPYPYQARERGVEGEVQVRMLVQQDGSVRDVFIVDARPQGVFEETVKKSLQQWRFSPGKIDGRTVTAWVVTTIHFDLN
jgi:TonB family protein